MTDKDTENRLRRICQEMGHPNREVANREETEALLRTIDSLRKDECPCCKDGEQLESYKAVCWSAITALQQNRTGRKPFPTNHAESVRELYNEIEQMRHPDWEPHHTYVNEVVTSYFEGATTYEEAIERKKFLDRIWNQQLQSHWTSDYTLWSALKDG